MNKIWQDGVIETKGKIKMQTNNVCIFLAYTKTLLNKSPLTSNKFL